jgi:hypothetical protein
MLNKLACGYLSQRHSDWYPRRAKHLSRFWTQVHIFEIPVGFDVHMFEAEAEEYARWAVRCDLCSMCHMNSVSLLE